MLERLEPARLTRREDGVRHHALGARFLVDPIARRNRHIVGQEPVLRNVGGRARDQRDLGVAVEEDLLEVVVPLQVLDGLRLVDQRRVPAGFADRLALAHERLDARVVTQEMRVHVHDELVFERIGALLRHGGRRGFRFAHVEDRAEGVVHRHEGRRHAARGLKELAAIQALLAADLVAHFEQTGLDLLLLFALRCGNVFVVGDDLRGDRRGVRQHFGRQQRVAARRRSRNPWRPPMDFIPPAGAANIVPHAAQVHEAGMGKRRTRTDVLWSRASACAGRPVN